jgi:SAM-dependent methyltransferase
VAQCNLCGSTRFVAVSHHDRYGFRARSLACRTCGLVFMSPRMTADAYARFYAGTYRPLVSAFHGRSIDATSVEADQLPYADRVVALLEPFIAGRRGGRILDVGGSTGIVAERVGAGLDMRAVVLDPAPDEVERARARGLEGVVGTIEDWHPDGDAFDLVLLCQTIDHLLDVAGSLTAIRRAIAPDGIFFVDIVDFRAAYLGNGSLEAATKVDHPFSLTQEAAEAYLARSGFEVLFQDYAPDHLHVGYVCRPASPEPDALPSPDSVAAFFRELRAVQAGQR